MSAIAFRIQASPESNDHEVRAMVDGVDLLQEIEVGALGIDPPEFFAQNTLRMGGQLLVGRCSCGVVGCGDVRLEVSIADGLVTWHLDRDHKYEFALGGYFLAVNSAASDRNWESIERTTERLVSAVDFSNVVGEGYEFEWASARIAKGRITLSFAKERTQRLFEVGGDAQSPEDAVEQVARWAREFA